MKIILSVLVLFFSANLLAETQLIKYKRYLVPINMESGEKAKVIVTTDYGSLATGNTDPNEPQDLVHFLAYSNHFNVRAIIALTSPGKGTKSSLVGAISRYANDFTSYFLSSSNGADYPTPNYLNGVLYQGVEASDGFTSDDSLKTNPSTYKIIDEASNASPICSVNILVWGSMADVASAVFNMDPSIRNNLRVIAIGSTNRIEDKKAWDYIEDIRNAGGSIFSKNIVLSDKGNPDAIRRLHLGGNCGVNPVLYDSVGVETIMNSLSDPVSPTNNGLRGLLQLTRDEVSRIHCQVGNPGCNPKALTQRIRLESEIRSQHSTC